MVYINGHIYFIKNKVGINPLSLMAANQNIMLLYFCRNLFRYYIDGKRNRAMSKDLEVKSAHVEYTLVAQLHNMHSRVKLAALHNTDDYGHHQSIILSFITSTD